MINVKSFKRHIISLALNGTLLNNFDSFNSVEFGKIAKIYNGDSTNDEEKRKYSIRIENAYPYIATKDISLKGHVNYNNGMMIPKEECAFKIAPANSILLCIEGGNAGNKIAIVNQDVCFVNKLCCFHLFNGNPKYIYYYLLSSEFRQNFKGKMTGLIGGVSPKRLRELLIPLPSKEEQDLIVQKLDSIFKELNVIENAQSSLLMLKKPFEERIYELALRGKLTGQSDSDGNSEQLYLDIQKEKNVLIGKKILKKEKPYSDIKQEEIPFEIPNNWKWCRIGTILGLQAGKNVTSASIRDAQDDVYKYLCYGGNGIRGYVKTFNKDGDYAIMGRQGALCGCISFAQGKFYATEHAVVVDHFGKTNPKWTAIFLRALNLNQYATATAQPGLSVAKINEVLIPLPPIKEQERIVEKVEELLSILGTF